MSTIFWVNITIKIRKLKKHLVKMRMLLDINFIPLWAHCAVSCAIASFYSWSFKIKQWHKLHTRRYYLISKQDLLSEEGDFWSLDLLEAIQGIAFYVVLAFSFLSLHFHFRPCIFIKLWYDCIKLHHKVLGQV